MDAIQAKNEALRELLRAFHEMRLQKPLNTVSPSEAREAIRVKRMARKALNTPAEAPSTEALRHLLNLEAMLSAIYSTGSIPQPSENGRIPNLEQAREYLRGCFK